MRRPSQALRWLLVAGFVAVFGAAWITGSELGSLDAWAAREKQLNAWQNEHPDLVLGGALAVYIMVTGLSLPGAGALSLIYGWLLGFGPGLVVVSFGSTIGATFAFLTARFLFRDWVERRFAAPLDTARRAVERNGVFYLFSLRMVPLVPFFVVNLVMGLTPMRVTTFAWVSQLGMLAGTAVYVYSGSVAPDLESLARDGLGVAFTPRRLIEILVALSLLGLLPWLGRWLLGVFGRLNRPGSQRPGKSERP